MGSPSSLSRHDVPAPAISTLGAAARSVWPCLMALALATGVHFAVPELLGPFYTKVASDVGIAIVLAVSLNIVNGFTGQFSIGHAGFMAVGGYTAASLTYYAGFLLWDTAAKQPGLWGIIGPGPLLFFGSCLAGGALAALCGWLVGMPSLRLKGDYLAIVTLGFGEIIRVLITLTTDVLYTADEVRAVPAYSLFTRMGGALGFSGIPTYSNLFWIYVWVGVTLLAAFRLKSSSHGRAFLSIREDEVAAAAMGVNVTRMKVRAFVISAFFAGVGGALFAHLLGNGLSASELNFQKSFDILIMVVLGGLGSISGVTLAAAVVTILPELLRDPAGALQFWWVPAGLVLVFGGVSIVRRNLGRAPGVYLTLAVAAGCFLAFLGLARVAQEAGIDLGQYRLILFALLLIAMMILRPSGLFGVHEIWELARSDRSGTKGRGS